MRRVRVGWILVGCILALTSAAEAQRLQLEVRGRDPALDLLREIVGRGDYRLIARDTLLPATDTVAGDLVVVGAAVRLDGSVAGSVAVLDGGDLFVRPGASIHGAIAEIGGSILPSARAELGEVFRLPAGFRSRVIREGDVYTVYVRPPPDEPLVRPTGFGGIRPPTYDRVDGLTLKVGGDVYLYPDSSAPHLIGRFGYSIENGYWSGRGAFEVPLGSRYAIRAEAGRATVTNDEWVRGDLSNSLGSVLVRSDVRNYYRSEWAAVSVFREAPGTLQVGRGFFVPRFSVRVSRDTSVAAGDPWSLFARSERWRTNPPVLPATLASGSGGFGAGYRWPTSTIHLSVLAEYAPAGIGDLEFGLVDAELAYDMLALWQHTLAVEGKLLHPLGAATPPPQRWSLVGGPGTLPTLRTGRLRGDHLVFLQSTYTAPVPRVMLPFVGPPSIAVRHAVGSAWVSDDAPRWEQNLGLGLTAGLLEAYLYVDPAETTDLELSIAATLPTF